MMTMGRGGRQIASQELVKEVGMAYIIAEGCTKDASCVDVCPVDCIHPRKDEANFEEVPQLYVDPVACIDCGACIPVCPVPCIYTLEDLPEQWQNYIEVNAAYYGN